MFYTLRHCVIWILLLFKSYQNFYCQTHQKDIRILLMHFHHASKAGIGGVATEEGTLQVLYYNLCKKSNNSWVPYSIFHHQNPSQDAMSLAFTRAAYSPLWEPYFYLCLLNIFTWKNLSRLIPILVLIQGVPEKNKQNNPQF